MSSIDTTSITSGSGLDVTATVDQLMQLERAPENLWKSQQQTMTAQATALRDLNTRLDTLETRINDLKDISGVFGQYAASSTNDAVVTATADTSAAAGEHTIVVTQLATVASQYTAALASPDATFTPGDLQLKIGSGDVQTITFDADHSTLKTAVDKINSSNLGVTASLLSDATGTHLVLVSNTPGLAGELSIVSAPQGLAFQAGSHGQNAKLTLDGVPIESATNEVSGVLQGVTLHLNGDTGGIGTRIAITSDTSRIQSAVDSFVSAYNDVVSRINTQFQYNSTSNKAGILAGDSTVRSLQASLLGLAAFRYSNGSIVSTLRSLGIKMQDDGTLQVDDAALSSAIHDHPSDVQKFFQGTNSDGFANNLSTQLANLTDSVNGPLLVDAKGLDSSVSALTDQIDQFETRMDFRYQQLIDEYSRIDVMLRQMSSTISQVQAQLGTLSKTS